MVCLGLVLMWHMNVSRGALPWVLGAFALLFNPLMPVHLDREIWAFLDVMAGGVLLLVVGGKIGDSSSQDEAVKSDP